MAAMRTITLLSSASMLLVAVACGDETSSGGGAGAAGGGGTTTSTSSGTGGTATGTGTGTGTTSSGTAGAPPCTADTLAEAVRITTVDIAGASWGRALTAQAGGASVVAWAAGDGVHVTPLDAVDERAAADLVVDGMQVYGVSASPTDVAVLVSRAPDYMTFTRLDMSGNVLASADLVGGGDHGVQGTEWFGEFANTGRMVSRGDGTYAAYHALHRHWPDGIGHQGDTLRLLDGGGSALGGGWGWGCSHSMDQRLAYGPNGLVPICAADCYPGKGIYFNHDVQQITPDPAANCAGGYSTSLGGLVAVSDGFFLVYGDAQGAAHLGHYSAAGQLLGERSLTQPGSSRLAIYGDGMLLGTSAGGQTSLQLLDSAGEEVGAPAVVAASAPDQDFESRSDGEVAWATTAGTTLTVVRVRVCP